MAGDLRLSVSLYNTFRTYSHDRLYRFPLVGVCESAICLEYLRSAPLLPAMGVFLCFKTISHHFIRSNAHIMKCDAQVFVKRWLIGLHRNQKIASSLHNQIGNCLLAACSINRND